MGKLIQYVDPATEHQITRVLARHLGSMELATRVTKAGLSEIGCTHAYAAEKVATTLKIVDNEVKAASYAGRLTPAKEAQIRHYTEEYLNEMLAITHDTGAAIVDILLRRQ